MLNSKKYSEIEYFQEISSFVMEKSALGKLNWLDIKNSIVYFLLMLSLEGLLALCLYIVGVGSIWKIDWKGLVDATVLPMIIALTSILKSLLTTKEGNFVGIAKIK